MPSHNFLHSSHHGDIDFGSWQFVELVGILTQIIDERWIVLLKIFFRTRLRDVPKTISIISWLLNMQLVPIRRSIAALFLFANCLTHSPIIDRLAAWTIFFEVWIDWEVFEDRRCLVVYFEVAKAHCHQIAVAIEEDWPSLAKRHFGYLVAHRIGKFEIWTAAQLVPHIDAV